MKPPSEDQVLYQPRALADTGNEPAWNIAVRLYDAVFLSALKERFDFDAVAEETARQLRDIAERYIVGRRMESQPEIWKSARTEYLKLQSATESFLKLLKEHEKRDIASDMALTGDLSRAPRTLRHDASYRELVRLLELLEATAAQRAQRLLSRGGRPKNFGLEDLTRHFDFVQALVAPIENVTDKQIITAMRSEIAARGALGLQQ
jgi:hypothetical protein